MIVDDPAQYSPSVDRAISQHAGFSIPAHSGGFGLLEGELSVELLLCFVKRLHFPPLLLFFLICGAPVFLLSALVNFNKRRNHTACSNHEPVGE